MKSFWTSFVVGIFLVGIFTVVFQHTQAQQKDPRVPMMKDSELSGIRVPVPGNEEMMNAIELKEKALELKEKRLNQLEERLVLEEERIKVRVTELENLQKQIEDSRSKYAIEDKKVLERMVKTFESMAPKKAATVLGTLEKELAVDVLMAMKEKKVASVLESMDPTRATELNTLIASRRPAGREESGKEKGAVGAP
jgi:flagellar motility protein MotE (MotC chaperone)